MAIIPVLARELRVEARHASTYWLRVLGVTALLVVALFFGINNGFSPNLGGKLFARLNLTLFCCIWILVPLLTADCISRERREGTLGLLFLTPLKPRDIVLAKSLAHGLRAATLCVAVVPVLAIPFLMGGVSWKEAIWSLLVNFASFCWALSAGLLASSRSRQWMRALVTAATWAFFFFLLFCFAHGLAAFSVAPWVPSSHELTLGQLLWAILMGGVALLVDLEGGRSYLAGSILGRGNAQWLVAAGALPAISLLALTSVILLAARNIRRGWQEEPPSARQIWWQRTFCTPVYWQSFFRRWMRRKLERNPIGWLQQRTWSGRLVTWSWLAILVSFYSFAVADQRFFRGFFGVLQAVMGWLLVGSMALSAAGSFRRERESGVLELLLVAPLSVGQIMGGRLRGLWGQFFLAMALLLAVWLYLATVFGDFETRSWMYFATTYLTLPVIGLYFSLRRANFISALLWTLAVGVFLPLALFPLARLFFFLLAGDPMNLLPDPMPFHFWFGALSFVPHLLLLLLALWCGRQLHRNLTRRTFALEKAVT